MIAQTRRNVKLWNRADAQGTGGGTAQGNTAADAVPNASPGDIHKQPQSYKIEAHAVDVFA